MAFASLAFSGGDLLKMFRKRGQFLILIPLKNPPFLQIIQRGVKRVEKTAP